MPLPQIHLAVSRFASQLARSFCEGPLINVLVKARGTAYGPASHLTIGLTS